MKKLTALTLASLLLLPSMPVLTSCSDENLDEEFATEMNEDSNEVLDLSSNQSRCLDKLIPKRVLETAKSIYSKASVGPQTVTTVNQLAILTSICATRKGDGPITVTSASLNGEDITLVTLGGTETVEGQATTTDESALASRGESNDYLVALTKLFENGVIPQSKPVIVTGISLGGMIAQQVLGQPSIMDHFDIRAVITFGSPLTMPIDRSGVKVVRFADVHDLVPALGEGRLRTGALTKGELSFCKLQRKLFEIDKTERVVRISKYRGMIETHALSYIEDPCWSNVDFLGDPSRKNVLELKEAMTFYDAPKLSK